VLAGLYPAFVLSAFKPVVALKNQFFAKGTGSSAEWLRKGLIVFQFTFSLALIAGTFIIGRQIQFMQDKDMGFNMDAIVHFHVPYQQAPEKKAVLKNKLEQLSGIQGVSIHATVPASNSVNTTIYRFNDGKEIKDYEFHVKSADTSYIHLYDISLLAGRNLLPTDSLREFLINEKALHLLGFKTPQEALDKVLITDEKKGTGYPIVGVVKDFHSRSLREPIHPLVIVTNPYRYAASVKLATQGKGAEAFKATMAQVEQGWKEVYPNDKFEYTFVNEDIAKFYENEQRMSKLMSTATGIAIFISCIGLFGLVSFTVVRRTKEIGIRKILGASVSNIVTLLSKDLLVLVLIAIALGSPIAWYFTNKWLTDFAYRVDIQWWMFAIAGAGAIGMALLTISLQAVRAAVANPVESLRSE
jgi:putative ABC transport system permease protein